MRLLATAAWLATLPAPVRAQTDLVVGPGGLSFLAAVHAARDGDRILLAQDVNLADTMQPIVYLDAGVTIEPAGPGRRRLIVGEGPDENVGGLIASGRDFALRRLDIRVANDLESWRPAFEFWCRQLVFEDCSVSCPGPLGGPMLTIGCASLLVTDSSFRVDDVLMHGDRITQPADALHVTAGDFVALTRTSLRGGSAPNLPLYCGVPDGGTSLVIDAPVLYAVDLTLSDGNGGVSHQRTTQPGQSFSTYLGRVHLFGVSTHEFGVAGGGHGRRGPIQVIGSGALGVALSNGRIGESMTLSLSNPPGATPRAGVLLGLDRVWVATPFGTLAVRPDLGIAAASGAATLQIAIPRQPALVGTVVWAQEVGLGNAGPTLGGATFGVIGR